MPESQPLVYFDIMKLDKDGFIQTMQEINKAISPDNNLISTLSYVLKNLSEACFHSLQAKSLHQFQNNLKFLNNVLINEMLTPFAHQGSELWIYFSFVCLMINEMLTNLKEGKNEEEIMKNSSYISKNEEKKEPFLEKNEKKSEYPKLDDTLTKDFWFKHNNNIDIITMANIIAYTVNSLFLEEKWNILIAIVRDFSNITLHCFSNNLLPFLLHAQNIILSQSHAMTEAKKQEKIKREEEFRTWEVK